MSDTSKALLDSAGVVEWLKPLGSPGLHRQSTAKRVGGKAATLARLLHEGFLVPRGWVIETRHFTRWVEERLPKGHDLGTLIKLSGTKVGIDRAARARDRLLKEPVPEPLQAALDVLWAEMEDEAPWGFAVRSSATSEDTRDTSMAGVATSVLGVRGAAGLGEAVRQVWVSAFLPRAIDYLAHAGTRDAAMGVLVQLMVRAEAAGVLFTAPPSGLESEQWRADERLINATLGLGAPVVEGAVAVDTVRISKGSGAVVSHVVVQKPKSLVVGEAGLVQVDIAASRAGEAALSEDVIRELAGLADRLEQGGSEGVDVEFAVEAPAAPHLLVGQVWLLQVRPLSGGAFPEGGDADTVWSRTNVGEALPGAATPLTWSVARAFSDHGFREAFAALGCHVPRSACLVANVQGRFYLNLTLFMQIAAQVPGLSPQALLGASGGASGPVIEHLLRQSKDVSKTSFYLRLPMVVPQLLRQQSRLERDVTGFEEQARKSRQTLEEMDLAVLPDDAIAMTFKGVFALLDKTGGLMLRCASASLASHLALCKLLERVTRRRASVNADEAPLSEPSGFGPRQVEHLAQTLAGGILELESARPGLDLAHVAKLVKLDAEARDALFDGRVKTAHDLPQGPARDALVAFLNNYGDRAVREAELSTPRWKEDQTPVLAMLLASIRSEPGDAEHALVRARAAADREMALLEMHLTRLEYGLLRTLVERVQLYTRLREQMRTWVTRVLGMMRCVALDIDRRLRHIDPTLPKGSVFFCRHEELLSALSSGRAELGHVVRLRMAEHARDAARPDPPTTFIGRPAPVTLPPARGTRFVGLPASGGVVEGKARVLMRGTTSLDALEPGEVLVSRTTDVGLSPLFLIASAVVTELGGPLSHASIVAREYGIPAVVNVPGITLAIKTGDRIRVDGDHGLVDRIEKPPSTRPQISDEPSTL